MLSVVKVAAVPALPAASTYVPAPTLIEAVDSLPAVGVNVAV